MDSEKSHHKIYGDIVNDKSFISDFQNLDFEATYNDDVLALDPKTCSSNEIRNWFLANNITHLIIGQRKYHVLKINDHIALRMFAELYLNKIATADTVYTRCLGENIPTLPSIAEKKKKSKVTMYRSYTTQYPDISPGKSYDDVSAVQSSKKMILVPSDKKSKFSESKPVLNKLKFLNINLRNATPSKLDVLVKAYHGVAVFLLNEIHLNALQADIICPAGYTMYMSTPDVDSECYAAILVKEEMSKYIKVLYRSFFCVKIVFSGKNLKYGFTSVYRPHCNSVKWGKCNKQMSDFYKDMNTVAKSQSLALNLVCGDFNTHFKAPKKSEKGAKFTVVETRNGPDSKLTGNVLKCFSGFRN